MKRERLLIAVGATGGHIYPALALAEELRGKCSLFFIGSDRGLAESIITRAGFHFEKVWSRPWAGRTIFEKAASAVSFIFGVFSCQRRISEIKPFAVLGTGSFATVPVLLTCCLLSVPFYILEADVKPGMTTRFFSRSAKKIFLSFEETEKYLPGISVSLYTGSPVRRTIGNVPKSEALKKFGLSGDSKIILVFGGSQGSSTIEKAFFEMCRKFGIPLNAKVIASAGKFSEGLYAQCGEDVIVRDYIEDMASAYACADIVVSRAGAVTVAEIVAAGKPAILVPLAIARGHQADNARQLEMLGTGVVIRENELTAESLHENIKKILNSEGTSVLYPRKKDSVKIIAEEMLNES